MFKLLNVYIHGDIFSPEEQMKNDFPEKKENNEIMPGKIDKNTNCTEDTDSSISNTTCIQLTGMIKRDKMFFNLSAKWSIFSN